VKPGRYLQVYLSTRRGAWIINRIFDYGEPADLALSKRYRRWIFPTGYLIRRFQERLNLRFDHDKYGLKPQHSIFRLFFMSVSPCGYR
jgi:dimethylaniline monooxygenase (N-oxide forming)